MSCLHRIRQRLVKIGKEAGDCHEHVQLVRFDINLTKLPFKVRGRQKQANMDVGAIESEYMEGRCKALGDLMNSGGHPHLSN